MNDKKLVVWRGFLRAYSTIMKKLAQDLQAEHGLALTWYDVLVQLYKAEGQGLSMQALADGVILSQSGLTRLVDRMVTAGLVERHYCEVDRRVCYAKLTAEGMILLEKVRPTMWQRVDDYFLRHVDAEAAEVLGRTFSRMIEPL